MKKSKRKKLKFWDIIIICLLIILMSLVGFITYAMVNDTSSNSSSKPIDSNLNSGPVPEEEKSPSENKINVALLGIDPLAIHSDVNMVASFDTKTKAISLISIPRDTKVQMPDDIVKTLQDNGKFVPSKNGLGVCKLTEVYAYSGKEYGNKFQVETLESILGIDIDYFVAVDTAGFRDVVDAVGGVDFEIKDRLYYEITDENITIDLYPGMQHLDGEKAEQLVRFRHDYAAQDLKRVEVQRDFLKALLEKVTTTETIIKNAPSLIKTTINYVTTDIGVMDALKYVEYLDDISMDNFYSETIPGEGGTYFTINETELDNMVQRIFYSDNPSGEIEETNEENTNITTDTKFDGNIEISNGGTIKGLAGKKAELLKQEGYDVTEITTYSGTQQGKTRIIVSDNTYGKDLLNFFPEATIEVNPKLLTAGTNMKIILGLDEK